MANTEIRRTSGSTPTNAEKFTISLWFKKSKNSQSSERGLLGWRENINSGNNSLQVEFQTTDKFQVQFLSNNGNNTHINLVTNRQLRDNSSWYHLVIAVDSSQTTASDRAKIYFNGVQETSLSSSTYPASGRTFFSSDVQINFGKSRGTTNNDRFFNGAMSHIHFIDGTAYDASAFGETDATTGEWKIKTSPSVTYGNNGFFILKDGNSVTDSSPNSNNFTVGGGTLTKTEDCPSDVFATFNSLVPQGASLNGRNSNASGSIDYGNNRVGEGSAVFNSQVGTVFAKTGKYYFEVKGGGDLYQSVGICNPLFSDASLGSAIGSPTTTGVNSIGIYGSSGLVKKQGASQYTGSAFASQIVCVAMDLDNGFCYFRLDNGSWMNSGVPTSGSTGTGGVAIVDDFYTFAVTPHNASGSGRNYMSGNFGNGYFGTTAVSSAGTNASGNGIFEHDVPSGYTALSTKGLNL